MTQRFLHPGLYHFLVVAFGLFQLSLQSLDLLQGHLIFPLQPLIFSSARLSLRRIQRYLQVCVFIQSELQLAKKSLILIAEVNGGQLQPVVAVLEDGQGLPQQVVLEEDLFRHSHLYNGQHMNKICSSTRLLRVNGPIRLVNSANSKATRRLLSKAKSGNLKKASLRFTIKSTKRFKQKSSPSKSIILGRTIDFLLTQKINTDLQTLQDLDFITSKSHIVLDLTRGQPLFGRNPSQPMQIASLTKIFTCYTAILIIQKLGLDRSHKLKVSTRACELGGTTAKLMAGDILSVRDLLYGMMLPSGNDAAFAIAEGLGKLLAVKTGVLQRSPERVFIAHINKLLFQLKILNTRISNPHGLSDFSNTSTAADVACLCSLTIKDQFFREIVSTQLYSAQITNQRLGLQRRQLWANTNRLLEREGYFGIKTGVTDSAGPCLATWYKNGQREYIVVLLKSWSLQARFSQTEQLISHLSQPHSVWYKSEPGNELTVAQYQ